MVWIQNRRQEWINNENDFIPLGYVLNKPNGVPFRTEHEEGYIYFVKIKEIDFQYELHKIYGKVRKTLSREMSIHLRLPYILNRILTNLTQRESLDVRQVKQCRRQVYLWHLWVGCLESVSGFRDSGWQSLRRFYGAIVNKKNRVCRYWRAVLVIFPNA